MNFLRTLLFSKPETLSKESTKTRPHNLNFLSKFNLHNLCWEFNINYNRNEPFSTLPPTIQEWIKQQNPNSNWIVDRLDKTIWDKILEKLAIEHLIQANQYDNAVDPKLIQNVETSITVKDSITKQLELSRASFKTNCHSFPLQIHNERLYYKFDHKCDGVVIDKREMLVQLGVLETPSNEIGNSVEPKFDTSDDDVNHTLTDFLPNMPRVWDERYMQEQAQVLLNPSNRTNAIVAPANITPATNVIAHAHPGFMVPTPAAVYPMHNVTNNHNWGPPVTGWSPMQQNYLKLTPHAANYYNTPNAVNQYNQYAFQYEIQQHQQQYQQQQQQKQRPYYDQLCNAPFARNFQPFQVQLQQQQQNNQRYQPYDQRQNWQPQLQCYPQQNQYEQQQQPQQQPQDAFRHPQQNQYRPKPQPHADSRYPQFQPFNEHDIEQQQITPIYYKKHQPVLAQSLLADLPFAAIPPINEAPALPLNHQAIAVDTPSALQFRATDYEMKLNELVCLIKMKIGHRYNHANPADVLEVRGSVGSGATGIVRAVRYLKKMNVSSNRFVMKNFCYDLEKKSPTTGSIYKAIYSYELMNEIDGLSLLEHPNLMRLHEVFVNPNTCMVQIIMPQMVASLDNIMAHLDYPFEEKVALYISHEFIQGLSYLHQCGYFHSDIKTANVLVNEFGEIKITDFGFLGKVGAKESQCRGTLMYLAPEVADEEKMFDEKSDMWSTGIMMIEFVDGNPGWTHFPYDLSTTDPDVCIKYMATRRPPFPEIKGLSIEYLGLVADLLQITPQNRPTPNLLLENTVSFKNLEVLEEKQAVKRKFAELVRVACEHKGNELI